MDPPEEMLEPHRWQLRRFGGRRVRLGPDADLVEHLAGHDEADGTDGAHQQSGQPSAGGGSLADQQPRGAGRVGAQGERPLEPEAHPFVSAGRLSGLRVGGLQYQGHVRLEVLHQPAGRSVAGGPHPVADREVLPLVDDGVSVVDVEPEQIFQPRIAVEAAAVGAHLHQPGPDLLGWRGDRDRSRDLLHRWRCQLVTGQRHGHFLLGRTPAALPRREPLPPSDGRCCPDAADHQ